jgi:hypothetical protein
VPFPVFLFVPAESILQGFDHPSVSYKIARPQRIFLCEFCYNNPVGKHLLTFAVCRPFSGAPALQPMIPGLTRTLIQP